MANKNTTGISRKRFLGLSAIAAVSAMGGSSISLSSCQKRDDIRASGSEYTAIVIGSGFGGSVAALRLGEAGINTLILEMGKSFPTQSGKKVFSSQFFPDTRASWLKTGKLEMPLNMNFMMSGTRHTGVLERHKSSSNGSMDIYRGTGLGGGSLVYGAMLPQAVPEKWDAYFPDIPYSEMDNKWYPIVKNILQARIVPDDIYNHPYYMFSRVGIDHAIRAGLGFFWINSGFNFDMIRDEFNNRIPKSLMIGEMMLGVNNGSKYSLDMNYIPMAVGTGNVTVKTLHKVENIRQLANEKYEIYVVEINETGQTITEKTYTCKHLFVTAGVVGSMNLLLKAKHENGLSNLSDEVGQDWGNNGNIMSMRKNLRENTGAKQCAAPIAAISYLNNPHGSILSEQAPFPLGIETNALMNLSLVETRERGYWQYNAGSGRAELLWNDAQQEQAMEAAKHLIYTLNDVNGGEMDNTFLGSTGFTRNFTYHPLGGASRHRASDGFGRLLGHRNLYCIDGSFLPGFSCCANPSLTIAALAERSMATIIREDF